MTTLRAHFDGRVLVPDEPVDLPVGRALQIQISEATQEQQAADVEPAPPIGERNGFPILILPANARQITMSAILQAEDDL